MNIDILLQDIRLSARALRKSPGFAVAAVLTLALAIGANAVVFGVLNAMIIRPLNVPRAENLYEIERAKDHMGVQSYPDYIELRDHNRSFEELGAFSYAQAALDTGANPARVWIQEASGNYFDVLGIKPYLGRFFHRADERGPNSAPYIVLSYTYWQSHFQADRGVLGRTVLVNKHPFTILGVAPPEFHGVLLFFYPEFWAPVVNQEQLEGWSGLNDRANRWLFMVMGHLKPGFTPPQATADLNSVGAYLERTYPKENGNMTFTLARPDLYGDFLGRPAKAFLTGLMALAGLILLGACANLGSLFAARAADRSREVALRLALGSSRGRILRGLFTEALLISLIGGAVGLAASVALLKALSNWRPVPQYPIHVPVTPDAKVYIVALALALVSGVLFGIVPVRQVLKADPYQIVKSGSRTTGGRRVTVRELLLGVQIAICALLVTSSMVAVRGLMRSLHADFGFEPRNVMLMETVLNMSGYTDDTARPMQRRMIDAMQSIPGVESAATITWTPLDNWATMMVFKDEETDLRPSKAIAEPVWYSISPEYFHTARTALLSGRTFTRHDDKSTPRVAVVNREFVRKILGATNPVGRYYKFRDGTRIQVVGVVEDGKYKNLTEDPQPAMFFPLPQYPSGATFLLVRSTRDPQQLAAAMRSTMRDLDAGLPCYIETWNKHLAMAMFPSRVATVSLGVMGIMGAMLSVTGIFGMAAYSVSKRLRELGLRMALGAKRTQVLKAALGRAFNLLALGSAAGLVLGFFASRVLSAIVYQATPRDPLVLGGVILAMLFLGLLATWIPAQRALSADPMKLLREE